MSTFAYPRLSRRNIIEFLADSQIATLSADDLQKPDPEFISNLYTLILIHIDYLQEDPGEAEFAGLDQLENPDLHVGSVRMMNLYRKMSEVIRAIESPIEFKLKDLVKPEPDRTEWFLSALLNFCLHKNDRMNLLEPFELELSALEKQRQESEVRLSQLNEEFEKFNKAREMEMPLLQELEVRVKELRQTISGLNNHQVSLKASIRKKKDAAKEMDEKISSAEFALVQSVQENANLREKIVQSPDKLQRALEEKKAIQVDAKNAERVAMQTFHEKGAMLEVYMKASKKMSKLLNQMQTLQEQMNSAKQVEKDAKILKTKHGDDAVLDKSLEAKLVERLRRVGELEELLKQSKKDSDLRCDEATKELNNVRSQVDSERCVLKSREKNVEAMVAEGDAINKKNNLERESSAAKQQELLRKYEEIVAEFFQYSNSMGRLLAHVEAASQVAQRK